MDGGPKQSVSDRPSPSRTEPIDALLLEAAAREVDGTLLDWALSLSPRERLRACSNAARALGKFRHVSSRPR
jgi:hypothetical protein